MLRLRLSTRDNPIEIYGLFTEHFFFFVVLEFELRAYTLSHSTSPFEIRSRELFAWAGFKL
jgi:hypothetical protein